MIERMAHPRSIPHGSSFRSVAFVRENRICGKKVIDTAADLWYHISVAKAAGAESRRGLGLLRLV